MKIEYEEFDKIPEEKTTEEGIITYLGIDNETTYIGLSKQYREKLQSKRP